MADGFDMPHVPQRPQPDGMSGLDSVQKAMESVQRKMAVYEGSLLQVSKPTHRAAESMPWSSHMPPATRFC